MARTYTGEFEITYYEVDARGRIAWDNQLDRERVLGFDYARQEAEAWMNTDEARKVRTVMPDSECVYMYAHPLHDEAEDMVAVIEKYWVDHAGVENV